MKKKHAEKLREDVRNQTIKEVFNIIDKLNKKYPSQCYGEIGIKWNEELKAYFEGKKR